MSCCWSLHQMALLFCDHQYLKLTGHALPPGGKNWNETNSVPCRQTTDRKWSKCMQSIEDNFCWMLHLSNVNLSFSNKHSILNSRLKYIAGFVFLKDTCNWQTDLQNLFFGIRYTLVYHLNKSLSDSPGTIPEKYHPLIPMNPWIVTLFEL